ncbi:Uma2 family endonuclease [Dapis sp. BLCC M229]|uniref:Uma2 family endonuclease n=1 Tax=Dapis sp. BLCC M229 TaxID=3400188 RepID=UPI003CEB249A
MIELRSADLFHVAFALAFRRKAKQKIFVCSRALALNYRYCSSPTTSFNYNYSTGHDITYKEQDRGATKILYYPCLIAEILSPDTEAIERGKKFQNYRRLSTLKKYLLINAQKMIVECFRLNQNGILELSNYGEQG